MFDNKDYFFCFVPVVDAGTHLKKRGETEKPYE